MHFHTNQRPYEEPNLILCRQRHTPVWKLLRAGRGRLFVLHVRRAWIDTTEERVAPTDRPGELHPFVLLAAAAAVATTVSVSADGGTVTQAIWCGFKGPCPEVASDVSSGDFAISMERAESAAFPTDCSLKQWQGLGMDLDSVVADPMINTQSWQLEQGSPALKLGFKQLNLSMVGPRSPNQMSRNSLVWRLDPSSSTYP